jgi:hypothetical protein
MPETVTVQRRVLVGYAVAGAGMAIAFVTGRGQVQVAAVAAANVLTIVAALVDVRRWTRDRRFGLSVAAGLALMSVEYVRRVLVGGTPRTATGSAVS